MEIDEFLNRSVDEKKIMLLVRRFDFMLSFTNEDTQHNKELPAVRQCGK
jgi:hypothetical protein